jgi:hypothetical protein
VVVCVVCGSRLKTGLHLLDFNKRILILKMHGANIKIKDYNSGCLVRGRKGFKTGASFNNKFAVTTF